MAEEEGYPLYVAEIALAGLEGGDVSLRVEAPSRFPGIDADLTLTHSVETPWAEIDRTIAELRPADLVSDDAYPDPADPEAHIGAAMRRDLMRSLGRGDPWVLMEQTTVRVRAWLSPGRAPICSSAPSQKNGIARSPNS